MTFPSSLDQRGHPTAGADEAAAINNKIGTPTSGAYSALDIQRGYYVENVFAPTRSNSVAS